MEEMTLVSQSGSSVVLKLNNEKKQYVVEEILGVHSKVYSDAIYFIRMNSSREMADIDVYVNGTFVATDYRDNTIYFCGENRNVFAGIVGLAQISLFITYQEGDTEWLYSEYTSVLIKATDTNQSLDLMLKYVYENQEDILQRDVQVTGMGKQFNQTFDDFWSQIVLLEEIANVYENNYGYFKANCRYRLEKVEVVDRVEKLQEIDSKTIQYISQHPEYLKNSVDGIKYGRQYFLPSKTLMMQKRITNDIYENQVVISFLEHISGEVTLLAEKIKEYIRLLHTENEYENGYIVSSYLLYVNAIETLNEFISRISDLEKQFHKLVVSYAQILNVKRINMDKRPEPTAIFMNLPQYNRIYTCILRWFGKSGYDLVNEKAMLNFMNAPSIYEVYVLIKMINHIKEFGYKLKETKMVSYPKQKSWVYVNENYNNTYIFTNEDSRITLYYEPVIYDEDRTNVNGISLYRNNSISLNRETDDERQGHYYVPDYVIKYEAEGRERYLICDAKFSRKSKVQYQLIPDLAYKYLTSISVVHENSEIIGLFVFYGLNEGNGIIESIYDRQIKGGKKITPRIELFPLSEGLSYSIQTRNAMEMLRVLIGSR